MKSKLIHLLIKYGVKLRRLPRDSETAETPQEMNERSFAERIHLRRICRADVGASGFSAMLESSEG